MRVFIVKEDTIVNVIKDGIEWNYQNIEKHITQKENMFFIEDMRVDPTGISKVACVPNQVTVGSSWADAGYYGFNRDGYTMLVHFTNVDVH